MVDSLSLLRNKLEFDNTETTWLKVEAASYGLLIAVPMTYL